MVFHRLDGSDERIDVWGDTAVVTYRYDCVWDFQGKTLTDDGHEILVFVREGEDWRIAWRTLIPGSRQIETCPTEQEPRRKGQDIRQSCLDLMKTSPACQLTTIDADGFPHTTAMNNLRCAKEYPSLTELYQGQDNDFLLYLSTSMQSDKMARIRANPKVSVYFCVPDQFIGLMLGGRIEVITDQALKNQIWQQGWTMYYPNGPEGPEYGVLRLAPTVTKGWFQGRPFEFQLKGSRG
jgi:general stress protein 26